MKDSNHWYWRSPGASDLQRLVEQIAARIGRALEHRCPVERDIENKKAREAIRSEIVANITRIEQRAGTRPRSGRAVCRSARCLYGSQRILC